MRSDPALFRPTFATIDLNRFDENVSAIRERLPAGSRLVAVLKADAYGHGAVALAQRLGADEVAMIAVALFEEAVELREAGITLPILTLGPLTRAQIEASKEFRLTLGVTGPEMLQDVTSLAKETPLTVHLKLDSGMNRMGATEAELGGVIRLLQETPRLRVDGIYTHFANASDPHDSFTTEQLARYRKMLDVLAESGVSARLHHTANSAATMRGLVDRGDYVRVGLALYGAEPLDEGDSRLAPILRWSTRIARLKRVPRGEKVGYGTTWEAMRDSTVATLPVGYADGYDRLLSNAGAVLIRGRRAPVIGRVSMDLVTIDVTDEPEARVGDEVVLLGRSGEDEISAEEIARLTGTISYEVFCNISQRVPRIYLDGGHASLHSKFV